MQFLRGVRIKDFRSLPKVALEDVGHIAPLVGPNGSGKSNVFRALNLFFDGEIEDGQPLELRRDFREPGRRQKLQITVEVDLAFGSTLRKEYKDTLQQIAGGSADVTVRKDYSLDHLTGSLKVDVAAAKLGEDPQPLSEADRALADRLINAITFRYVPNHQHPSEVLRHEEEKIRRMLFSRVGRGQSLDETQLDLIQQKAANLMAPVEAAMKEATGEVESVQLGTPGGWKDLVWAFGLKLQLGQSESYEAILHGSGVQSVLAYSVLALVDTSFGGSFGWRLGTIWAIEEPESFLHANLQASLAQRLADYARGERLQILMTTHSPAFLGVSDEGFAVTISDTGRSSITREDRQELILEAQRAGVAPFAHPLHTGPPKPLLLVEGKHDRELLQRAYLGSSDPCPYEIIALDDLESTLQGGVDQIATYLQNNHSALRARPNASPVVVLLDWEVPAGKVSKINAALKDHATSVCIQMPETSRNQDLSKEFVGIEGFLSTAFYDDALSSINLPLTKPAAPAAGGPKYAVNRAQLRDKKDDIQQRLQQRNDSADIDLITQLLPWLNGYVTAGKQSSP